MVRLKNMWSKDTIEWIDIELTSFCNIECPGCLRQVMNDKVGHILNKSYTKLEDLKLWIPKGYLPNLKKISFKSDILKRSIKLNVTNAALRTVDFKGGLDKFLKTAKSKNLSKRVQKLKYSIVSQK